MKFKVRDPERENSCELPDFRTPTMSAGPDIQNLTSAQDAGLGSRAQIGMIVLQSDQTIEHEFAALLRLEGLALYHARIPNEMEVTCDTLRQMETDLPVAAGLLPVSFDFDAIGYCCTSGATMIGEDRVDQILRAAHPKANTSNPITACKAALRALGLKRIALITPYAPDVTVEMRDNLAEAGFEVNAIGTFNQSDDFKVARISSDSRGQQGGQMQRLQLLDPKLDDKRWLMECWKAFKSSRQNLIDRRKAARLAEFFSQ